MVRTLDLTPALRAAIDAVHHAERTYVPGVDSAARVEIPKLDLANAILEAIDAQAEIEHLERLNRLPRKRPTPVAVVEVELRHKRRKPA
jgi:hypothetical protein